MVANTTKKERENERKKGIVNIIFVASVFILNICARTLKWIFSLAVNRRFLTRTIVRIICIHFFENIRNALLCYYYYYYISLIIVISYILDL